MCFMCMIFSPLIITQIDLLNYLDWTFNVLQYQTSLPYHSMGQGLVIGDVRHCQIYWYKYTDYEST